MKKTYLRPQAYTINIESQMIASSYGESKSGIFGNLYDEEGVSEQYSSKRNPIWGSMDDGQE